MSTTKSFLYNEQAATKHLKVACVAMTCDRDPDANRGRIVNRVNAIMQTHPDIELVLFGEMILGWYSPARMPEYHRRIAEPVSRETLQTFISLAVQHRIYLCFGMSELDDETLYNAQVLINPQGEIQAVHRKWNLKPAEKKAGYQPGPVLVTTTEVKGIRTGIVICSDTASPRVMWDLIKSRLDLILLSLADDSDEDRFAAKFSARMYDAWLVTANRYGDEDGHFWNGHMVVSDPLGVLRTAMQDKEGYLVYELAFDTGGSWLKRIIRNAIVKAPLPFHVIKNWRRVREYL
jgi:predicted amidohydrolase